VQLPLIGAQMPRRDVSFDSLDLIKDVDGLTSESVARLGTPRQVHIPATALGIAMLLEHDGFTSSRERGAHVAIVGKGRLCGSPLGALLSSPSIGASVTLCDVFTRQTSKICRGVDVIVSAVGGGHVITAEHVDPDAGTVVIDVGAGDVSPDAGTNAKLFVSRVGELTVAALGANTLNADRMRRGQSAIDFVQLARNAHLLPDDVALPLDAALSAPLPPADDDGRSEPWFQSASTMRETAELSLAGNTDIAAALSLFALPRDRPMTVVLNVRTTKFSNTDAIERLCCAMVRATDIVCVAVQNGGAALSPLALAADYCLTTHERIDVDALLAAPSALSVARARIGDVVMVPGVAFGDLVRDGTEEYLHSLVGYLRQHHNRIRVAALQRKLELRMRNNERRA
jgi:hypothetical protein